jgi:glycosyltransferase involved in cell wall biosynthesis
VQVTALVEGIDHVCCRYRLAAFRSALRQAGHELELCPLPAKPWQWLQRMRALGSADAVILQRRLLPPWQLALLRRAARFLIFDFDDAIFGRDSYAARGFHSRRRQRRFVATIRSADAVTAGNAFLQAEAARWRTPQRVYQLPTCVDATRYPLAAHRHSNAGVQSRDLRFAMTGPTEVHLVWIGSGSTLRGLERAQRLFEHVGRQCPGLSLNLVCDRSLSLACLPVRHVPWSAEREPKALAEADIGISWVPDDPWSRGKCGLKILQYMAAGLPVVANPVGVQAELVVPDVTGFLAETPTQWADAIALLANDPILRRRLGAAGRRRVEAEYSLVRGTGRWLDVLAGVPERRRIA